MNGCRAEADVAISATGLDGLPKKQGKVRDVYDLGDRLLLVASDRISAFDWVLPTPIPDKGRVLSSLSEFWFERLGVPNHLISTNVDDFPVALDDAARKALRGRAMLVRKAKVAPFECVVRGYLSGSGWKEYRASGSVCGVPLPAGLVESDRLPEPVFTPATKAETGHDENVSFDVMANALGAEVAGRLRDVSLDVYARGAELALSKGLILADTKFEWGFDEKTGELLLIDEVLTPDSSRYWSVETYKPGGAQPSFDKQFVRDWLETTGWDKASEPPPLPEAVVAGTRSKYIDAYERLTGRPFPWR
ncbi:MAG: phosphoribosylaminoimidazolesuccinocarboxamide synthase [Planctomycetales bacterium 71-10]|nr:MAG: phosphoribosylaminoimidazolesuccinocarboxamide synthase [Planctomycetales bacterium 71-10]